MRAGRCHSTIISTVVRRKSQRRSTNIQHSNIVWLLWQFDPSKWDYECTVSLLAIACNYEANTLFKTVTTTRSFKALFAILSMEMALETSVFLRPPHTVDCPWILHWMDVVCFADMMNIPLKDNEKSSLIPSGLFIQNKMPDLPNRETLWNVKNFVTSNTLHRSWSPRFLDFSVRDKHWV